VTALRRYWREALLIVVIALPWLSLLVLGLVWLWQGGHTLAWAAAAAAFGLLAWPLRIAVKRQAKADARRTLADAAAPAASWNAPEQAAWAEVVALADATEPLPLTDSAPLVALVTGTITAVARRLHPEARDPWAQFSLPEALLLAERLARDIRGEALRHIPGVRTIRLSHVRWLQRQADSYGEVARKGWTFGFGAWRVLRGALNPIQAAAQEARTLIMDQAQSALSYRLRAYATRMIILEVGRASIDLYSGRLALSEVELRAARERDLEAAQEDATAPVRILLAGQVNAGKSTLVNALATAVRAAAGPLPTTAGITEYLLELEGRPAVVLVDTIGLGDHIPDTAELGRQAARADLILWVAAATQPARAPDRAGLDAARRLAADATRRPPKLLLALTHVDELRPASEWAPPYDIGAPQGAKARAIRAALEAVAKSLGFATDAVIPVALPPGGAAYNVDALWARIGLELDEARLVQLDRLRVGAQGLGLRELAAQLGEAGRMIVTAIVKA
jgi:uncharacterized protein